MIDDRMIKSLDDYRVTAIRTDEDLEKYWQQIITIDRVHAQSFSNMEMPFVIITQEFLLGAERHWAAFALDLNLINMGASTKGKSTEFQSVNLGSSPGAPTKGN